MALIREATLTLLMKPALILTISAMVLLTAIPVNAQSDIESTQNSTYQHSSFSKNTLSTQNISTDSEDNWLKDYFKTGILPPPQEKKVSLVSSDNSRATVADMILSGPEGPAEKQLRQLAMEERGARKIQAKASFSSDGHAPFGSRDHRLDDFEPTVESWSGTAPTRLEADYYRIKQLPPQEREEAAAKKLKELADNQFLNRAMVIGASIAGGTALFLFSNDATGQVLGGGSAAFGIGLTFMPSKEERAYQEYQKVSITSK